MAVIFNEKYISPSTPAEVFDRLREYSNVHITGFDNNDPDKYFNVGYENTTYYINYRNGDPTISSAELKLTRREDNTTEVEYTIINSSQKDSNKYSAPILLSIGIVGLSVLIYMDGFKVKYLLLLLLSIFLLIFSRLTPSNSQLDCKEEYLDLYEKIKNPPKPSPPAKTIEERL
jgi:hypothetical protein